MEKNRIRPIKSGRSIRMSYQRRQEVLEMPNLIEVQKASYEWFVEKGLREIFDDISPIEDFSDKLSLEFVDYELCRDEVKYPIEECKERDANFAAPLKVTVRLLNKENGEIKEHEIFMGDLPLMTATGTFIINGAERVIVSQLVRSPGIYYGIAHDKLGKKLYSCTVIPNRGAWLEYETDSNDIFYVRVDRTRKVPVTQLIRAMGIGRGIVPLLGKLEGRVLDLAGGPGAYAILMAQANPQSTYVTVDLPAISAEAAGYVAQFGLAGRIECRAGDYHADEYEAAAYDVVTIFGALHQESPAQIVDILKRAHRALRPGGRIFVLDMMTDATHTAPKFSALFAVNMALTTENGWVFADTELKEWLREAGFRPGETRPVPPPMPHWLVDANA